MSVIHSIRREEQSYYSPPIDEYSNFCNGFDDMMLSQSRPASENSFVSSNYDPFLETNHGDYLDFSPPLCNELDFFQETGRTSSSDSSPQDLDLGKTLTNLDDPGSYIYDLNWPTSETNAKSWNPQYPHFVAEPATVDFGSETFSEIETVGFDVDSIFVDSPSSSCGSESSSVSAFNLFPCVKMEPSPFCSRELVASESSGSKSPTNTKPKTNTNRRRHGRQPTLWQFLYHALDHPKEYNHMISWVDMSKGIFEFSSKNKDDLARAWGAVKNNRCTMTYPKLARALRKYIEMEKFVTKYKRKLQYVFRPEFLQQLQSNVSLRKLSPSDEKKMYEFSRCQIKG